MTDEEHQDDNETEGGTPGTDQVSGEDRPSGKELEEIEPSEQQPPKPPEESSEVAQTDPDEGNGAG